MNFMNIFTEPAIIIITTIFLCFIVIVLKNYNNCEKT